jgi:hypothetical protein
LKQEDDLQMRWKRLSVGILALGAVLGLVLVLLASGPVSRPIQDPSQGDSTSPRAESGKVDAAIDVASPQSSSIPTAERPRKYSQATARQSADIESAPAGARSEEDAVWLRRYLYPTSEELYTGPLLAADNMPRNSGEITGAEAALFREGLHEDAELSLNNAAMMGSIYALIALAQSYEQYDPVLSRAYFRAAIMRGDWLIALRPFMANLTWSQDGLASLLALQMLEDFDHQRALRGLPPLRREMRPGLPRITEEIRMAIEIEMEDARRALEAENASAEDGG